MDPEIQQRFEQQEQLLQNIYASTEKTRKIFLVTLIVSLAVVFLPLIGLAIVIPSVLSSYAGLL